MVQINNTLQISVSRLSELPQVCEHGQSPVVPPGKEGKLSVYSAILCQQNIYIWKYGIKAVAGWNMFDLAVISTQVHLGFGENNSPLSLEHPAFSWAL